MIHSGRINDRTLPLYQHQNYRHQKHQQKQYQIEQNSKQKQQKENQINQQGQMHQFSPPKQQKLQFQQLSRGDCEGGYRSSVTGRQVQSSTAYSPKQVIRNSQIPR